MARAPRSRQDDADRQAEYRKAQRAKGIPDGRAIAMAAFRQFVLICHRQSLTKQIDGLENAVIRDLLSSSPDLTEAGIAIRFEAMVDEFIRQYDSGS